MKSSNATLKIVLPKQTAKIKCKTVKNNCYTYIYCPKQRCTQYNFTKKGYLSETILPCSKPSSDYKILCLTEHNIQQYTARTLYQLHNVLDAFLVQ